VVDPVRVVRVALESAASIAGLLWTTDALVVDDPSEGPQAGGEGPAEGPPGAA
jgi:chaperonin GroEL